MTSYVGIDIAKDSFVAARLRPPQAPQQRTFANTPAGFQTFLRWLNPTQAADLHLCMEATGYYYLPLADFLDSHHLPVSVVNPQRIAAYADSQLRRNKTDALDAVLLADFCQTQHPPLWTAPDAATRELIALVRRYDDLTLNVQQERNRLHAAIPSSAVQLNIQQHLTFLNTQLAQLKAAINHHIDQHPQLKQQRELLQSIPGIGNLTACKLLAELHDWQRFTDVRQVVAYAGLNPQLRQSGKTAQLYTPISKQGSAPLRHTLYMPALSALQHNPLLATFAQRLRSRGLRGKAVIVAVMRKLLHLIYGILKSGQPFDPLYLTHTQGLTP